MKQEYDRVLPDPKQLVTMDTVRDLPYCCAVFNEVMRMHAPVPIDGRICNEPDHLPSNNALIEKNDYVWIPIVALGRDPRRYGPDADVFRPSRWLDENSGDLLRFPETLQPVFWGGPRGCLGQNAARLEVLAVTRQVLRHFSKITPVHGQDFTRTPTPVRFFEHGCRIRFHA